MNDQSNVEQFWSAAQATLPAGGLGDDYTVRQIGVGVEMTRTILDVILAGEKTGSSPLPWLYERGADVEPMIGEFIVLVNGHGEPEAIVQTTSVEMVPFGKIELHHLDGEGPAMRDVEKWSSFHANYWAPKLEPFGLQPTDEMPVAIQRFGLVYRS